MLIETIDQLKQQGFEVKKTTDLQTIVSHRDPFMIEGTARQIPAQYNSTTERYTAIFESMCSNGKIPNAISHTKTPLILQAITHHQNLREQQKQQAEQQDPTHQETVFENVAIDQVFYLDEQGQRAYRKTSDTTFVNADVTKISSKFDFVAKPDRKVYMEQFDTSLTAEQKQQLVDMIPQGLSQEQFDQHVAKYLEDVPGLELYDERQLQQLHQQLFLLYRNTQ